MYHPAEPTADEAGQGVFEADSFEFIELHNIGSTTLDLTGARFTRRHRVHVFTRRPAYVAPARRLLTVVEDPTAFTLRYGSSHPIAGQFYGRLNNAGEHFRLEDTLGMTILDFTYDDTGPGWHPATDGDGYSLVIVDPTGPTSAWNQASGWRASHQLNGSPGEADTFAMGDLDGDQRVGLIDLALLRSRLETAGSQSQGDLSGDGLITRRDVAMLVGLFGRDYTPPPAPSPVLPIESSTGDRLMLTARRRAAAIDRALSEDVEAPITTAVDAKLTTRVLRARRS